MHQTLAEELFHLLVIFLYRILLEEFRENWQFDDMKAKHTITFALPFANRHLAN